MDRSQGLENPQDTTTGQWIQDGRAWWDLAANYSIMGLPQQISDPDGSSIGWSLNTGYNYSFDLYDGNLSSSNLTTLLTGATLGDPDPGSVLEWARDISLGIVLASLSLLTFVGNAMVLHAVRTERRLQSVSNMFIVSLAIADLIVGLIVMPISAIYIFTVEWNFGVGICQFWIGVDYTASTASILNLFILSLDRYWSVTSPLRYIRQRTRRRALIMISLVWFASSLWIIPIVGWHQFEHNGVRSVPSDVCDTEYATNTTLKIITGVFNFYLPLAIMYALYGKIFIEIKRRSKMELGQRTAGGANAEPYITTSVSDDSDEKQYTDAIPLRHSAGGYGRRTQNGRALLDRTISQMSTCSNLRTDLDTDTDQTDDEAARLHRGGYTNLTLVKANEGFRTSKPPSDMFSAGNTTEFNKTYVYDESVLESTTEKVHRYYYEQQSLHRNRGNDVGLHGSSVDTLESSHNGNGRVRFQIDHCDATYNKASISLPKETHPAKNTYVVKPRCYQNPHLSVEPAGRDTTVTSGELSLPSKMSHSSFADLQKNKRSQCNAVCRQNNNGTPPKSALVQQAMRWRRKVDKNKHKPSSALSKEIKAARQLGVIMGAFTVCFLPYFVCFMVVAFCDNCVDPSLMTAVTWVGYLNSTLNPFLYPLCNANFRRKFRTMLRLSSEVDRRRHSVYYNTSRAGSAMAPCDI